MVYIVVTVFLTVVWNRWLLPQSGVPVATLGTAFITLGGDLICNACAGLVVVRSAAALNRRYRYVRWVLSGGPLRLRRARARRLLVSGGRQLEALALVLGEQGAAQVAAAAVRYCEPETREQVYHDAVLRVTAPGGRWR